MLINPLITTYLRMRLLVIMPVAVEKLSLWRVCNPGVIRWRRFFAFVFYLRLLPEPVGEFSF